MPTPLRLAIQQNLCDALAEISTGNGYNTNLPASSIFRGRVLFGDTDPVPMVAIYEPPIPLDQQGVPFDLDRALGGYELYIQGFVKDDSKNPTDPAHYLMADVKKRLAAEKVRLYQKGLHDTNVLGLGQRNNRRNHIDKLDVIGPGVVRPPVEGQSNKAFFWLNVIFQIVEDIADPFV